MPLTLPATLRREGIALAQAFLSGTRISHSRSREGRMGGEGHTDQGTGTAQL